MNAAPATGTEVDFRGQRCVAISLPQGDSVMVSLQGAQVLSWRDAFGREVFYLSPKAVLDGKTAIRGGVPVCFPQFNQRVLGGKSIPKHGFVRNETWSLQDVQQSGMSAEARFGLASSPETLAIWPHDFNALLKVRLEPGRLRIGFEASNTSTQAWPFALALHSYLYVDDIARTQVEGLAGVRYWDGVLYAQQPDQRETQSAAPLEFPGETDRVYEAVAAPVNLYHPGGQLRLTQSASMPDLVVWNPAAARCATLDYMPADGYKQMLCIEAARVNDPPVLAPGQSWSGWQQFDIR